MAVVATIVRETLSGAFAVVEQTYRYDPLNEDCECFQYARARAAVYCKYHKTRFCGDLEDLEQIAVMAIVELAATVEDQQHVSECLMKEVVEKALRDVIKSNKKQSPVQSVLKEGSDSAFNKEEAAADPYFIQQPEFTLSGGSVARINNFREAIVKILGDTRAELLWAVFTVGGTLEEAVAYLRQINPDSRWNKVPFRKTRKIWKRIIPLLKEKLSEEHIQRIATLPSDRERIL